MLYMQHYIKTVHFLVKISWSCYCAKDNKLIEGGHHGHVITSTFFNVFYVFFQNPKSRDFLPFLLCFVRFLELWFNVKLLLLVVVFEAMES